MGRSRQEREGWKGECDDNCTDGDEKERAGEGHERGMADQKMGIRMTEWRKKWKKRS